MSEADAVGAGFGADISALIAWGTTEALAGEERCEIVNEVYRCYDRFSDKAQVALILGSGFFGYPLGVLYPRNARYNVTPGDIRMLYATTGLGILAGMSFLPESPKTSTAYAAATAGGVIGLIAGVPFLVRRFDHGRSEASRVTLGTGAGALMGAGIAALVGTDLESPQLVFGIATAGGLLGLIVARLMSTPGRLRATGGAVNFNPASILSIAARTPGNQSLFTVRF